MKMLILTAMTLLSISASAKSSNPTIYCVALMTENGVTEKKSFTFECDNYGEKATFESKSKRFYVSAFSEESCTPQLIIHDGKTNTVATGVAMSNNRDAFEVFTDKLVAATIAADIKRDEIMTGDAANKVVAGCSTDKSLLKDLE